MPPDHQKRRFGPEVAAKSFAPREREAAGLLAKLETGDGSHDLAHICRVWANVKLLATDEHADLDVLMSATILHDCVFVEKNSPMRRRASRLSAVRACDILFGLGREGSFVSSVAHAIEAHSFSGGVVPETAEARVLRDADRLDAIGAIGIARCFYVSGRLGRMLYDPEDPGAEHRPHDDETFAIDHFPAKLFKLQEGMLTSRGRVIAQRRTELMTRFLADLSAEIGGANA
ncbi:uncharacterized protein ACVIGB_000786 [Bradyrhizobium sp. USDA 4341]